MFVKLFRSLSLDELRMNIRLFLKVNYKIIPLAKSLSFEMTC